MNKIKAMKIQPNRILFVLIFLFFSLLFVNPNNASLANNEIVLTKISQVDCASTIFDVDLEGDYAYFADYSHNLVHIADISNPFQPEEVGNFSVGLPHYFEVQNGIAYVAAWTEGVQIFNVSEPTQAYKIGDFEHGTVGALTIKDNLLFAGVGDGVYCLDVSTPSLPFNNSFFITGGNTHDFFVVENLVYTLAWNWTSASSWIRVIDYSTPESPIEISSVDLGSVCYDIHIIGEYAYLAASHDGIKIVDFTDINEPSLIVNHDLIGEAFALEVRDDLIYLGNGYSGLEVYDVSNITNPIQLDKLALGSSAEELEIRNDLIYVTVDGVGLVIVQIEGLETSKTSGYEWTLILMLIPLSYRNSRRKK